MRKPRPDPVVLLAADIAQSLAQTAGQPASVDRELASLLQPASSRTREIVGARTGFPSGTIATLESMGAAFGVTRERARQVEQMYLGRLRAAAVMLPHVPALSAAVACVRHAGAIHVDTLRERLAADRIEASQIALRSLPAFHALGIGETRVRSGALEDYPPEPQSSMVCVPLALVGDVLIAPDVLARLDRQAVTPSDPAVPAGAPDDAVAATMTDVFDAVSDDAPLTAGEIEAAQLRFEKSLHVGVTHARRALRRMGVLPLGRMRRVGPLSAMDVARNALHGRTWTLVDRVLIPDVRRDGEGVTLRKAVGAILAACGFLTVLDLRRALRQGGRHTGTGGRPGPGPMLLPLPVLSEVLRRDLTFALVHGVVTLRPVADASARSDAEEARRALVAEQGRRLHPAEVHVLRAMETRDGFLTLTEVHAILVSGGYNASWVLPLTQSPYLMKVAPGVYTLRGFARRLTNDVGMPPLTSRSGLTTDAALLTPTSVSTLAAGGRQDPRTLRDPEVRYERTLVEYSTPADDEPVVTITWRVTRSLLRGAVRLPVKVETWCRPKEGDWPVADGTSAPLSVRDGTVYDLSPWLAGHQCVLGDHVTAQLDRAARQVRLVRVPAHEVTASAADMMARHQARLEERLAERLRERDVRRAARAADRQRRGLPTRRHRPRPELQEAAAALRAELRAAANPTTPPTPILSAPPLAPDDVAFGYLASFGRSPHEVLIAVYRTFPLSPATQGVAMGAIVRLDHHRGKRRFVLGLLEAYHLDDAQPITAAEAELLVPGVRDALGRYYHAALAWRSAPLPPPYPEPTDGAASVA